MSEAIAIMSRVTEHDELLKLVAERAAQESSVELTRATPDQVREAETALGFPLPPLLARLYQEVGNGGFGPDYQLLPLIGEGRTVVSSYHAEYVPGEWPAGVIPILDWGCAMYAAVDCTDPQGPVLLYEPNAVEDDWSIAWYEDAESLASWLQSWLSGTGWYEEEIMMNEDDTDPTPWPQAKHRLT